MFLENLHFIWEASALLQMAFSFWCKQELEVTMFSKRHCLWAISWWLCLEITQLWEWLECEACAGDRQCWLESASGHWLLWERPSRNERPFWVVIPGTPAPYFCAKPGVDDAKWEDWRGTGASFCVFSSPFCSTLSPLLPWEQRILGADGRVLWAWEVMPVFWFLLTRHEDLPHSLRYTQPALLSSSTPFACLLLEIKDEEVPSRWPVSFAAGWIMPLI